MKLVDIIVISIVITLLIFAIKTYSKNKGCGCNKKDCPKRH